MTTNDWLSILPPFAGENKKDRKRQLILHTASVLFNTRGPRAVKLTDITELLGLTKTSLYYYVKNKEDLVYQCYKQSCEDLSTLIEQAYQEKPQDFLATLLGNFIEFWASTLRRERPAMAILSEISTLKEPHRAEITEKYVALVVRISELIKNQTNAGFFPRTDAFSTAHSFFAVLQWTVAWLTRGRLDQTEMIKTAAIDLIRNGIATRKHPLLDAAIELDTHTGLGHFDRAMSTDEKLVSFVQEACRQFNTKGYMGTSITAVSEKLDVTKGAFYYYVENKQELLVRCSTYSIEQAAHAIRWATENGSDGLEKVYMAFSQIFAIQNSSAGPLLHIALTYDVNEPDRSRLSEELINLLQ